MRRGGARFAWAAVVLLGGMPGAVAEKLVGHSFTSPPDIHAIANEWYMAGTAIPTARSIMMSPAATGRIGVLFGLSPVLTGDFEAHLSFKVQRPPAGTEWAKDAGFAMWYVQENGTKVLEDLMTDHAHSQAELIAGTWGIEFFKHDIHLSGYKSHFNGLGVFIQDHDQPTISMVHNDGSKDIRDGAGLPTPDAIKYDSNKEIQLKLRVQSSGASLEVVGYGTAASSVPIRAGGYIGFTSYGGTFETSRTGQPQVSSTFELTSFVMENHDKAIKGEEVHTTPPPPKPVPQEEKVDVLAEASSFKDLRAESDAIKDLTNMVFKLVVETQPMRLQMTRAIENLGKRISTMEKNFDELKAELDKKTGHKLGEEFAAIKEELSSLSSAASKETEERHQKLKVLHEDIELVHKTASSGANIDKHLDKLSDSNNKVLDQLTNEHQKMFGVSIAAIAFIVIAGLSLYNKFRCWEKKHVL